MILVEPWWKKFIYLNVFQTTPPSTDAAQIQQQLIATRLFVYLLVLCTAFLLTNLSVEIVETTYTVKSPTYEQFITIHKQYNERSLVCPCSSVGTEYKNVFHIEILLHPYCSSDFVRSPWLNVASTFDSCDGFDFPLFGPPIFQTLASYCRLATSHIQISTETFNATQLITAETLDADEFQTRAYDIANSFINSMTSLFLHSLNLATMSARANGIVSAHGSNFYPYIGGSVALGGRANSSLLNFLYRTRGGCYCYPSVTCPLPVRTYGEGNLGFFHACLPEEGVRRSNLGSLFDQTLVDILNECYVFPQDTTKAMNITQLNRFELETTVSILLLHMLIDQWNLTSFHRAHYEACHPQLCTYILADRKASLTIITTMIGLIEGLMSILQIASYMLTQFIFVLITFIICRPRRTEAFVEEPFTVRALALKCLNKLKQLNFFPSFLSETDEKELKTERISTRLVILLMIVSVITLSIYSARTSIVKTVTTPSPSLALYRLLYADHANSLSCPCNSISISHKTFLTLRPTFHQVCSSVLVNPTWIVGVISNYASTILSDTRNSTWYDFRLLGGSFFYTIAFFCEIINNTLTDALARFDILSIITSHVIPESELNAQGLELMSIFIRTTTNEFLNSLRIIRDTTQSNALISGYATNIQLALKLDAVGSIERIVANYTTFGNCSCATSSLCSQEAGIYGPGGVLQFSIPGIRIGCFAIEATLQSTLSILYSQEWINNYRQWTRFTNPYFLSKALNSSVNRNLATNDTMYSMIQQLMVDEWTSKNISFSNYFVQCQPFECKYTYVVSNDITYIATTSEYFVLS